MFFYIEYFSIPVLAIVILIYKEIREFKRTRERDSLFEELLKRRQNFIEKANDASKVLNDTINKFDSIIKMESKFKTKDNDFENSITKMSYNESVVKKPEKEENDAYSHGTFYSCIDELAYLAKKHNINISFIENEPDSIPELKVMNYNMDVRVATKMMRIKNKGFKHHESSTKYIGKSRPMSNFSMN
tara:strand:- start:3246 stop:3809 length:564 start_codon:yes stop_codon:yes gene_type:complete